MTTSADAWIPPLLALALGRLAWGPVEYLVHGFMAHRWRTFVGPIHGGHHLEPAAVFTSPVAWLPVALLVAAAASALAGARLGLPFALGLVAGFAHYEYQHWRMHFRVPRTARQIRMRQHHLAHHFVKPQHYHGVTTRLWDRVFGTLPEDCANDYVRVADREPLTGPSNLRLLYSAAGIRNALRQRGRGSRA